MALKDVLRQFERFRMEHPQLPPKDIHELVRDGSYSGTLPPKDNKGMVN
jgi:hypothetical protein